MMIIEIRECYPATELHSTSTNLRHRESHIFDGKILLSDATSFQVCDITDPVLVKMLHDPENWAESFDVRLDSVTFLSEIPHNLASPLLSNNFSNSRLRLTTAGTNRTP